MNNDRSLKRLRKILESQIELLSTKPEQANFSELGQVARTLFNIIEHEERIERERQEQSTEEDDVEDTDAIVAALTTEEDARLDQLFNEIDELKNIGLARLGRQQRAISKDPFEPVYTPTLDYVFTLIHRHDPDFASMLDQFVTKHKHTLGWSRLEESIEQHVVRQIEDLLSSSGLRQSFDVEIDKLLARTASESETTTQKS